MLRQYKLQYCQNKHLQERVVETNFSKLKLTKVARLQNWEGKENLGKLWKLRKLSFEYIANQE